ncbi:MAG: glycosyltransferase, partial [Thiohalocapsa sp.]
RGRLLRRLGRLDEAIEQWQAICGRNRQNIDAWHELVFMLASAEREAEAVAALDSAEAALPATAQSAARLGLAAQAAQLDERAIGYFERAIAADPNDAAHQAQLGQYYLRQGIVDGAFHHLLASRELKANELPVAKQLVKTVHILNDLGIDHVALHRAPPTAGEVLVPERLFQLVRRLADTEVARYEPVPRRVIAISASLAPGGAERQLVTMLRGLADPAFGLDLALFCVSLDARTRRDFFLPLLADTAVEVVVPPTPGDAAAPMPDECARFSRLIGHFPDDMVRPIGFWLAEFRRRRPQIVHAWQDATNLTAVAAALLAGVPRIVLAARSVRPDNPRRRLKRYMQEAYRAVLGHKSVVLSNNSRAGADDYALWLGLDPAAIEVVYNGIDFAELERGVDPAATRDARDGLAIPADAPVLGSAFRMSEEKRPSLWVEAAAAVARAAPRAHFVVCGDGPMRTEMAALAARLGIADRLHLPGPQSNIASWYKAMDVVMLTSRHEGLPNVLLEAQCLGVPVVAPDVGGMSETVWQGVTGWTIRDADAASLAERVLYCLGDAEWLARARAEAPRFVKQRFDTASMLRRTLEVYGIPLTPPAPKSSVEP